MRRRVLLLAAALTLSALPAAAAPSAQDRALAEALFRQGRELGQAGKIGEACRKFEESWALDPTLGTKLHVAACYEEAGRTASAWAAFNEAADLAERAGDKKRETLARERVAHLEKKLPRLVIEVDRDAGITVLLDDRPLGSASLGTPLPVDPGEHTVTARAPGRRPFTTTITVAGGAGTDTLEIPALTSDESGSVGPLRTSRDATSGSDGATQRALGWVVGGVGVVGIGVGSAFGLRARSQQKDADAFCSGSACTQAGLDGHDDARRSARLSNIGFGVGLAGLAAGVVLVLTAPDAGASARALTIDAQSANGGLIVGPRGVF